MSELVTDNTEFEDEWVPRITARQGAANQAVWDLVQEVADCKAASTMVSSGGGTDFTSTMKKCGYNKTQASEMLKIANTYLLAGSSRNDSTIDFNSLSRSLLYQATFLDDPFDIPQGATVRQITSLVKDQKDKRENPDTYGMQPYGDGHGGTIWRDGKGNSIHKDKDGKTTKGPGPSNKPSGPSESSLNHPKNAHLKEEFMRRMNGTYREEVQLPESMMTEEQAYAVIDIKGINVKVGQKILKIIFNALSKEYHPDAGGNSDDMVLLNAAREVLLK